MKIVNSLTFAFLCVTFVSGQQSAITPRLYSAMPDPGLGIAIGMPVNAINTGIALNVTTPGPTAGTVLTLAFNQQATDTAETRPPAAKPAPVTAVPKAEPVDLTSYYHSPASSFDEGAKYPWRDVPKGSKTFANVPLAIEGRVCLWGKANADRGLVFPERLDGIKVNRKFDSLYLYHATFHNSPEGTPVVTLVLKYEDGSTVENDLCYGEDVRDWYQPANGPEELTDPRSKMAWSGVNSLNPPAKLQFFITEISNPQPDIKVTSIDLVSAKKRSASCILAMTTGPTGLMKIEPATTKESRQAIEKDND